MCDCGSEFLVTWLCSVILTFAVARPYSDTDTDATSSSSGLYNSLVIFGSRKRPITYSPSITKEDILQEIINLFSDVDELQFVESSELVLQIKSEEWYGEFVDVIEGSNIPDRSVLQIIREVQTKQQVQY